MRHLIRVISLFFDLLLAPVLGLGIASYVIGATQDYASVDISNFQGEIDSACDGLQSSNSYAQDTQLGVYQLFVDATSDSEDYKSYLNHINDIIASSVSQKEQSDIVLEQVLSNLLGDPIATHKGANSAIKIYTLDGVDYRGYMAKITPYNSRALNIVLAEDKLISEGERTSDAAVRTGGIFAVNAGGFMGLSNGCLQPLGLTVVNGKVMQFSTEESLTFVGFNSSGKLVTKKYKSEAEILADRIRQGASFSPTLLQDGKKVAIPAKWANDKHPRTIIGSFSNDDILVIVIDGRRTGWSEGVTLEEVQDKLLSFKIKNAYNLDGGGSSVFYYDGKILNKPSGGTERLVTTNLVVLP
jgi:exopolysaccharide biosynthesis protein